jgi:tRNA nucleotidyltransferase (CCA-adding enzyme)
MNIPSYVIEICRRLNSNGYQAYMVGGAVRDLLLGRVPKDYDVVTDATPEVVKRIFPITIPTGERFGTVTVRIGDNFVEVTTMRCDGDYSDGRRPDSVTYTNNIEEDLARRDFAINAIAYNPIDKSFIDPHQGRFYIQKRTIGAVGNPIDRFNEDGLRIMRALRFLATLPGEWNLDHNTFTALFKVSQNINNVSMERIRDELDKTIVGHGVEKALSILSSCGIIRYILPELADCVGVTQNEHHIYDVFGHILKAVHYVPPKLNLRLAALFHDIGKPICRSTGEDGRVHFYDHHFISADMTRDIMKRLRYSNDMIDNVSMLVEHHMFFVNAKADKRTVRRLLARIGTGNIYDLIDLRKADQLASRGVITELTVAIESLVEEVLKEPPPLKLEINGNQIMEALELKEGPEVGRVIKHLKSLVVDEPSLNNYDFLLSEAINYYTNHKGEDGY